MMVFIVFSQMCIHILSPDDATRVILVGGSTGDYINANYVNMEIPGSGIINRYIACQGKNPWIFQD